MEYISLIMAEHLSHDVLTKLGEIGVVQFTDVSVSTEKEHDGFERRQHPLDAPCASGLQFLLWPGFDPWGGC
jgi:vacuolar-type H+-ATPase subunit I/STV1